MEGVEWKWGVDSSTIYDVVDGGRFLGVKLSIKIVDGFHSVRADVLDERGKQRVVGRPCRVGSTPKSCALIIFNAVHPKNMWCMRRASEICRRCDDWSAAHTNRLFFLWDFLVRFLESMSSVVGSTIECMLCLILLGCVRASRVRRSLYVDENEEKDTPLILSACLE